MLSVFIASNVDNWIYFISFLVLSWLGTFSLFSLLDPEPRHRMLWLAMSSGLGPLVASFILSLVLTVAPGAPVWVYMALLIVVFTALLPFGLKGGTAKFVQAQKLYVFSKEFRLTRLILSLAAIAITVWVIWSFVTTSLLLPLTGNDPLLYFSGAEEIAATRSMASYPFVAADGKGGFYGGWTHGAGFTNILVIGYWLQGTLEGAHTVRLIGPYYVLANVILIWTFASKENRFAGPLATILLLSTPLFLQTASQTHIDPIRIFPFTCAFFMLRQMLERPSVRLAIAIGILAGLAQFSHSLGLLILPILIPTYFLCSGQRIVPRVLHAIAIALTSLLIMVPTFYRNFSVYGTLASDETIASQNSAALHMRYLELTRDIATPLGKVWNGALSVFSQPSSYGDTYWVLLITLVAFLFLVRPKILSFANLFGRRSTGADVVEILFWVHLGYFGIVTLSVLLDSVSLIKNSRYPLSILPMSCALAAVMMAMILKRFIPRRRTIEFAEFYDAQAIQLAQTSKTFAGNTFNEGILPGVRVVVGGCLSVVLIGLIGIAAGIYDVIGVSLRYAAAKFGTFLRAAYQICRNMLGALFPKFLNVLHFLLRSLTLVLRGLAQVSHGIIFTHRGLAVAFSLLAFVVVLQVRNLHHSKGEVDEIARFIEYFGVDKDIVLDSEKEKVIAYPWGNYQILRKLTGEMKPDGYVLTFRPSDFAFYFDGNYYDYQDPVVAKLFTYQSEQEVLNHLKELKITHIHVPNYALPEIYGSAMGKILGNTHLVQLTRQESDYRVFKVRGNSEEKPKLKVLYSENLGVSDNAKNWEWLPSSATYKQSDDGILIQQDATSDFNPSSMVLKTTRHLNRGHKANSSLAGHIYRFQAHVIGDGDVNVSLTYKSKLGADKRAVPNLVWNGVLDGKTRQISGIFFVSDTFSRKRETHEIYQRFLLSISQRGGTKLGLEQWSLSKVNYADLSPIEREFKERRDLLDNDWKVTGRLRRANHVDFGMKELNGTNRVFLKQNTGHPVSLVTPTMNLIGPSDAEEKTDGGKRSSTKLELTTGMQGSGFVDLRLDAFCRETKQLRKIPLGRVSISKAPKKISKAIDVDCDVESARAILTLPNTAAEDGKASVKSNMSLEDTHISILH